MSNRLSEATSPYLLQHAENPVHWREWEAATLAEAEARDVPIILSVGYAACHWCHVMAHESFEDQATANLMNEHFVSIKVDREERPDLDQIYMHALHLLGEQGGWPLTMFLTPAGEPFWGGTYFPPTPRYGRPSFKQVLNHLAGLWQDDRAKLLQNRDQLVSALADLGRPAGGEGVPIDLPVRTAYSLARRFDQSHGGLQGAPKFPQAPILDLLRRTAVATGDRTLAQPVIHTLRRMAQGGIYDHLGGGFARYSVDTFWLVPHFEKMLYDNAQLLSLLAEAFLIEADPLFRVRASETVAWLKREMMTEGAFAASLDADSEGEEGRFYAWDAAEITAALGDGGRLFNEAYAVSEAGNWEGRNVLNRLHQPGLLPPADEATVAPLRQELLALREQRPRPARDDKILADWNGLMIQGLARAGAVFSESGWIELAAAAFDSVMKKLAAPDGSLRHAWRDNRRLELGLLDDQAQMARAALALFEATAEQAWLDQAVALLDAAHRSFADPAGGYTMTAKGSTDLLVQPKTAYDGPSPAALATFLESLALMHALDGRPAWRERADLLVRSVAGEVAAQPAGHSSFLAACLALDAPIQIVLIGDLGSDGLEALRQAALTTALPHRAIQVITDGMRLPSGHPAYGKQQQGGLPTAYVCVAATCTPPIAGSAALTEALRDAALRVGAMTAN